MKTYKIIISAFALVFAVGMMSGCGESADENTAKDTTTSITTTAEQEETPEKTTTTTAAIEETTSTAEPETNTMEPVEDSELETTPTESNKHEIATTPVETMPENGELLPVEECLRKLISENVGADVEISSIECNEIEGVLTIYLDNGMEIDTTNVASHYAAGDKTSLDNYEIYKDTVFDYFILYWG